MSFIKCIWWLIYEMELHPTTKSKQYHLISMKYWLILRLQTRFVDILWNCWPSLFKLSFRNVNKVIILLVYSNTRLFLGLNNFLVQINVRDNRMEIKNGQSRITGRTKQKAQQRIWKWWATHVPPKPEGEPG